MQLTVLAILLAAASSGCGGSPPTAPSAVGAQTTPSIAAAPGDLAAAVSAAFDALAIPSVGACSISVSRHGQVVLERGRGVAAGQAANGDSLYRIASLTKPMTASAVLISEKAGRLQRTDKVSKFLAFPEPAPTIDELVKHVPGLFDYLNTSEYQSGRTSATTVEHVLSLIKPWDGVKRYQYSNSHAFLSGAVLQKVNGQPYEQVLQRDIFGPAAMSRSSFDLPPPTAAFPFAPTHSSWVFSAGGVTSTAADMNRFNQALLNNVFGIGAVESFDRGAAGVTSFGMGSSAPGGDLRFTHTGLLDSYGSYTVLFPADRASIVVLCDFPSSALSNFVLGPGGIRSIMLAH